MTRVADSSFLVALFDEDDPRRSACLEEVRSPEPILVPGEVVSETLGVSHVRYAYEAAVGIWDDLGDLDQVVFVDTTSMDHVAPIFRDAEGELSWTDAAVVAHCLREDAQPLCFDPAIEGAVEEQAGARSR